MPVVTVIRALKLETPFAITAARGERVSLSEEAAAWAVRHNFAIYYSLPRAVQPLTKVLDPPPDPEPIPLVKRSEDLIPETPSKLDPVDLVTDPEAPKPMKRPYGNAPKNAWIDYAVSVDEGLTRERAEMMTKSDLMSRYGERL